MDRRLNGLDSTRVLVVGDLILDRYWYGTARRISPEAPVPVVVINDIEERAGGAANVAANTAALGAQTTLIGVTGADDAGLRLSTLCAAAGITPQFVCSANQTTVIKLRVVSQHQQLVRLDFESAPPDDVGGDVLALVAAALPACDIVVISDYAKGAMTRVQALIAAARAAGKRIVVDPKGTDFVRYAGATLITPNLHEFEAVVGPCTNEALLVEKAELLCADLALAAVLITRGDAGMSLVRPGSPPVHLAAQSRDVFDVTGAGDTVCAVTATALAAGHDLVAAVTLANAAAGLVVAKFGAATVTRAELDAALASHADVRRGVITSDELGHERALARRRGETIVMTNGCFDVLHEGHVRYLSAAKALGTRLIVAVNDDASVTALKGPARPLNSLASRMYVLAALAAVDWVVPFSADTPRELIAEILPDVLVKGGDYAIEDIAGATAVMAAGGRVTTVDYHAGFSTSTLVERVRAAEPAPP